MRYLVLACVVLGACKWTEFDDISDAAWVVSTQKPDNDSASWAVAIQRVQRSGGGGTLAVLGASEALYSEITFDGGGDDKPGGELNLAQTFAIGNVDVQPILIADPTLDQVALVTKSGAASIAVLSGAGGQLTIHSVFGPERPDAATYMIAPGLDGGAPQPAQTLVAQDDRVFGTFFGTPPNPQVKCKLVDGGVSVNARALGAVRLNAADTTDDVVVWGADGKLLIYDGGIFDGDRGGAACPDATPGDGDNTGTSAAPLAGPLAIPFMPETGSQILVFDHFAVLQGHTGNNAGFLALVDLATMQLVGTPHTETGLKTAALFELGGARFVLAGYPSNVVDGTIAGEVLVFPLDTATGIGGSPAATLHDAQPESNQAFGRGVTALPYNGTQVIAVAADNEVFTYFRIDPLYADARQGR